MPEKPSENGLEEESLDHNKLKYQKYSRELSVRHT